MADHGSEFKELRDAAAGFIFLGVPAQGCDAASFAHWIKKAVGDDQPLLRSLRTGNPSLLATSRDFWNGYGKLPITCFFEKSDWKHGPIAMKVVLEAAVECGLFF